MSSFETNPILLAGRPELRADRVTLRNPFNDAVLGEISQASSDDAERACASATYAFKTTRRLPSWQRSAILMRLAHAVAADSEIFSRTIVLEAAKPIVDARKEVSRALQTIQIAAEEARRIEGGFETADWTPGTEGRVAISRRFPIGPVLGITPFNFPLNLVAHKLAPAIASGNPIIIKPAPQTPLTALHLGRLAIAAGWPADALSVLPCSNDVASKLLNDDRIAMLSFTGSAEVGWKLKAQVPRKRVTLELGGNAAVIVCEDSDLDLVAQRLLVGGFTYAGQSCISVQRVYAHSSIKALLIERLRAALALWVPGDPSSDSTIMGPMISRAAAERVEGWISEAQTRGGILHSGGVREGALLHPTLLSDVPESCTICCEEAFAPVIVVNSFDSLTDAIASVNSSAYGLQAAIFTHSWPNIACAWRDLEVGAVLVDESSAWRAEQLPYGGVKNSGIGKEGLRSAIDEMTEPRLLILPS